MILRKKMREDNRGIALISVMVCVMLSFLLSATILRISLLSYLQKGVAKQATETFYETESFMDDIKMGVQQKVALAFADSSSKSQDTFIQQFKEKLLGNAAWATDKAKVAAALKAFVSAEDAENVNVSVEGACFVPEGNGEVVIKDVVIEYTVKGTNSSRDGYYAKIKTDIRIRSPFYITKPSSTGGSYCMLAGSGTNVESGGDNLNDYAFLTQNGDVYIGFMGTNNEPTTATALIIKKHSTYILTGDNVVINGGIDIKDGSNLVFLGKNLTVRGTIAISNKSHLILSKNLQSLKCKAITVDGGKYSNFKTTPYTISTWKLPERYYNNNSYKTYYQNVASSIMYFDGTDKDSTGNLVYNCFTDSTGTKLCKAPSDPVYEDKKDEEGHVIYGADGEPEKVIVGYTEYPISGISINDSTCQKPHKRVQGSDNKYYDEVFSGIIDISYFSVFANSSAANGGQASRTLASGYYTPSSNKYIDIKDTQGRKWFAGAGWSNFDYNNVGAGSATRHNDWYYTANNSGPKIDVNVMAGKGLEENNPCNHIFINGDPNWNMDWRLNAGDAYYGIYLTPYQVNYYTVKGCVTGHSLAELDTTPDKKYYKQLIDKIGLFVQRPEQPSIGTLDPKYCVFNNWFVGGIKVLYEGSGTGTEEIVENDEVKNKSLEIVSFENWRKE